MEKVKKDRVVIVTVIILIGILAFLGIYYVFNTLVTPDEFDYAKRAIYMDGEFESIYGKIENIEQIGEPVDSEDKRERYIYCKVTVEDGTVVECTAVLEINHESKYIAPLRWEEGIVK